MEMDRIILKSIEEKLRLEKSWKARVLEIQKKSNNEKFQLRKQLTTFYDRTKLSNQTKAEKLRQNRIQNHQWQASPMEGWIESPKRGNFQTRQRFSNHNGWF